MPEEINNSRGLAGFILGAALAATVFGAVQFCSERNQTADAIKSEQAAVTRRLDSMAAVAKRASDSATAWKAVAQDFANRVEFLSADLARLQSKRATIKTQIDSLPDTALVKRYYMSLYGG
jgi:uncharacterized protein YPO0396